MAKIQANICIVKIIPDVKNATWDFVDFEKLEILFYYYSFRGTTSLLPEGEIKTLINGFTQLIDLLKFKVPDVNLIDIFFMSQY